MFLRREKLPLMIQLRELIWPSMGWQRTFLYIRHRLVRLPDTNHQIALGLSMGVGISFTPTPGLHIIQAWLYTYWARGNVFASFIGTLFGNPWTLLPMWGLSWKTGQFIFEKMGFEAAMTMPKHLTPSLFWQEIVHNPMGSLVPWLVGGYVVGALSLPIFYGIFYYMMVQARAAQTKWVKYRIRKVGDTITEKTEP